MKNQLIKKTIAFKDIDGKDKGQLYPSLLEYIYHRYFTQTFSSTILRQKALIYSIDFLCHLEREVAKLNEKNEKYSFYFNLDCSHNVFGVKPNSIDMENVERLMYVDYGFVVTLVLSDMRVQIPFNISMPKFKTNFKLNDKVIVREFKKAVSSFHYKTEIKLIPEYDFFISINDLKLKDGYIANIYEEEIL